MLLQMEGIEATFIYRLEGKLGFAKGMQINRVYGEEQVIC